jgi:hypothetical protein
LIDRHWHQVKWKYTAIIVIPYIALVCFFLVWSDWALDVYIDQREILTVEPHCARRLDDYMPPLGDFSFTRYLQEETVDMTNNGQLLDEQPVKPIEDKKQPGPDNSRVESEQTETTAANKECIEAEKINSLINKIKVITWICLVLSFYFILIEVFQAVQNPTYYSRVMLTQLGDLIGPILIAINTIRFIVFEGNNDSMQTSPQAEISILGERFTYKPEKALDKTFWLMQALAQLTIWVKAIQIVRINSKLAYLMQMIFASMYQIIPFLSFLVLSIFALGSMFLMISKIYIGNEEIIAIREFLGTKLALSATEQAEVDGLPFVFTSQSNLGTKDVRNIGGGISYSFGFAIGPEVGDIGEFDWFGKLCFIFSWIFIQILLLNLLIAIIGSVYAEKEACKD